MTDEEKRIEEKRIRELYARIRQTPLIERLNSCQDMIVDMCAHERPPIQWDNEDVFLDVTLSDARQEIETLTELLRLHAPKTLQRFEEVKSPPRISPMNQAQRIMLTLGFVGITILCLCPPHQWERTTYIIRVGQGGAHKAEVIRENAGHHWIWAPPQGWTGEARQGYYTIRSSNNVMVDWSRLSIYVAVIAAFTLFAAFVVFRKRE